MPIQDNKEITSYVDLFVSVIICFPEITTIKYDRESDKITFNFVIKNYEHDDIEGSLETLKKAPAVYFRQKHYIRTPNFVLEAQILGDHAVLKCLRDMSTITREEISFIVELFRVKFSDCLVTEVVDREEEGNYHWSGLEIDEASEGKNAIKQSEDKAGNKILVCREAGKVLVFINS